MAKKAFSGSAELVFKDGVSGDLPYFAYGSLMNHEQLLARGAKPTVIGAAKLADHQLAFFDYSPVWDGAEESVVPAAGQEVWGVIYELTPYDRDRLDDTQDARFDGTGAYFHYPAKVTDEEGKVHTVLLYKKNKLGTPQTPSVEYLDVIVQGAVEHQLPAGYVETLRGMEAKKAEYAVPRPRRGSASGGGCSECDDTPAAASGSVININLGS